MIHARAKDALLAAAAFLGTAYPVALAYRRFGPAAPFKFFANDAFYYLNVAERSRDLPFFTYDGAHPTNGFHPLWQWLLTFSFAHLGMHGASDEQVLFDYVLCAVLCASGAALLALTIARLTGSRPLALFATVPGFYDLFLSRISTSIVDGTETAPWSFVNGMETGLSVFFFGVFAWLLFRGRGLDRLSPARIVALSCVLTAMVLSRLDDVFLLAAFCAGVAAASVGRREAARNVALAAAAPSAALVAYLSYNLRTTGLAFPVSGSSKLALTAWLHNAHAVVQTLVPTLQSQPLLFWWDAVAWRTVQLVVPAVVAGAVLLWAWRAPLPPDAERGRRRALLVLAGYVVLKAGYNGALVPLFHQGHWYFPVSIEIVDLIAALAVARAWRLRASAAVDGGDGAPRSRRAWSALATAGVALFIVLSGNAVVNQKTDGHYADASYAFWSARHAIDDTLRSAGTEGRVFELDDGIMGYALRAPTMNAMGLSTDREAAGAFRRHQCFDVARARGFDVLASVTYWSYLDEQRAGFTRPEGDAAILGAFVGPAATHFMPECDRASLEFSVLRAIPVGRYVFYFLRFGPS